MHTFTTLALNSGSSSLKFGLYDVCGGHASVRVSGEFQRLDQGNDSLAEAMAHILRVLDEQDGPAAQAVGHRIVHGGPHLREHCRVTPAILAQLQAATAFAPLHTPAALAVLHSAQQYFPSLPQVVCLDTAFHAHMPDCASVLPLPAALRAQGVQRYGFHGLSCESIVHQLGNRLPGRLLVAHLGNGASVTAIRQGVSIDTSMGLTPSGGLIMGTRSGDLDPGVLIYLARQLRYDAEQLEDLIDHHSGLAGISGLDGDMRTLQRCAARHAPAALAIEMFCQATRKHLAAMWPVLDGVDLLVFTGGIGEHDADIRTRICRGLASLGVAQGDDGTARCAVQVLASREDEQIALHTAAMCAGEQT